MKSATMVTSDNQKSAAVVPGTNKYTMEGSEAMCLKMFKSNTTIDSDHIHVFYHQG